MVGEEGKGERRKRTGGEKVSTPHDGREEKGGLNGHRLKSVTKNNFSI